MPIYDAVRGIFSTSFNNCQLASACGVSEATVRRYRRIIQEKALTWADLSGLDDQGFYLAFNRPKRGRVAKRTPDLAAIDAELSASGMTLQHWYEDHMAALEEPSGFLSYTHLAALLKRHRGKAYRSMRQVHTPGEKVSVDYCGDRPHYMDAITGERVNVEVFVGALNASSLIFATATATQRVPDFLEAHIRMFDYFGGRTDAVVPDNLASAVSHPGSTPVIQRSYADFAAHYDVMVMPARPRRPKDKPKAEASVKLVQRMLKVAAYRRPFTSLDDINDALAAVVERINNRPMKNNQPSRRERFETYERHRLLPLPEQAYSFAEWVTISKVPADYHVPVLLNFYSVPHHLVGERVEVRLRQHEVTIFKDRKVVAAHARLEGTGQSTSKTEHMPEGHRAQAERAPDMLREWAEEAGPHILKFVREKLDQGRTIRGVPAVEAVRSLAHKHGAAEVDAAIALAYQRGKVDPTSIRRVVAAKAERVVPKRPLTTRNSRANGGASC
ncbi:MULTISPECIES: IS21 family transposase [Luteibacter]|uniref:IS21 family transposase n=1 Tax=Luteibacter TaxID=242605 RepID=UPI00068F886C|nr:MULTISPECIES: IS21 family transposase [unclassified Luteibacter]